MSLIFEALKKLEREKQAPERGILVVGPTQWAGGGARVRPWVVVAGAVALVALGVAIGLLFRQAPPPPAAPAAAAEAPPPALPVAALPPPAPRVAPVAPTPEPPPVLVVAAQRATPRPAEPTPQPTPAARDLTLQAVTEQNGVPVALINDRLMRVGDAFEGVKVIRIDPGEVEVEVEATGQRRVLTF